MTRSESVGSMERELGRGHTSSEGGFTLVHVAVWASLVAIVLSLVTTTVDLGVRGMGVETRNLLLDLEVERAMNRLVEQIRAADSSTLVATEGAFASLTLEFRSPVGFVGGEVEWGPTSTVTLEYDPGEEDNGVDDDGDGLIDEGRLVWTDGSTGNQVVLSREVGEYFEGEVPNGADDNGNGLIDERGFSAVVDGSLLVLRLTVECRDRFGVLTQRSQERRIALRNGSEP